MDEGTSSFLFPGIQAGTIRSFFQLNSSLQVFFEESDWFRTGFSEYDHFVLIL